MAQIQVRDPNGRPVPRVNIRLSRGTDDSDAAIFDILTDPSGNQSWPIPYWPAWDYTLHVNMRDLVPGYGSVSYHVEAGTYGDVKITLPFADPAIMVPERLRVDGRRFVTESGRPWRYVSVSQFAMFPRWVADDKTSVFAMCKEIVEVFGRDVMVRTFRYAQPSNPFALIPGWSNERLDKAVSLCRYLASQGLRIDFTAGDAQVVLPDEWQQQQEVNAFYSAIEAEPNATFNTINEGFKNGLDVHRVKPPKGRALRSSGFYPQDDGPYSWQAVWGDASLGGTTLDFNVIHSARTGLDTDYPKAIWDSPVQMLAWLNTPLADEEPFGFDEVAQPGRRSNRPDHAYILATERGIWDIGVGFLSSASQRGELMGPVVTECAKAFVRGVNAVRER